MDELVVYLFFFSPISISIYIYIYLDDVLNRRYDLAFYY